MATYDELFDLRTNPSLLNRITAGVAEAAIDILGETTGPNLVARKEWAAGAIVSPFVQAEEFIWAMLIENQAASPTQILAATDTAILASVNAAIDLRLGGPT